MLPLISPRDRESPTVAATSRKNSSSAKPISPAPPRHVEISQSLTAADSTQVLVRDLEPLQLDGSNVFAHNRVKVNPNQLEKAGMNGSEIPKIVDLEKETNVIPTVDGLMSSSETYSENNTMSSGIDTRATSNISQNTNILSVVSNNNLTTLS